MKRAPWKIILAPLSALSAMVLALRHEMYDSHLLHSSTVAVPTICVGNLAVGGTGKTPHIEYLIRLLQDHYRVAVVSRGYGRRTRGFRLAGEAESARTIGDELMQVHRKFPDIPVVACKDRVEGINRLKELIPEVQVVLLDDAFQHRSLQCGLNILLTTADNLYVDDHLLPWGTLRDLKHRAHRADAIIITKCPDSMRPIDKRVLGNKLHLPPYQKLFFSHIVSAPLPDGYQHPLLITGIAHPQYLQALLKQQYRQIDMMAYPDHHHFTAVDVQNILRAAQSHDVIFTTEKDYERLLLTTIPSQLASQLVTIPMTVDLDVEQPELERLIVNYVGETLRHNHLAKV